MDKEEIWMCFFWMLRLIRLMDEYGWVFETGMRLNRIFITLKGTPTISIHHIQKPQSDIVLLPSLDPSCPASLNPGCPTNQLLFESIFSIFQLISLTS